MTMKIEKKIKGYEVVKAEVKSALPRVGAAPPETVMPAIAEVIQMHEKVERPDVLIGATYKIKSPLIEHAMYVTINDIV
ncbi:MAG: NrdJb, partial [Rhodanobacteraceae bacterium]